MLRDKNTIKIVIRRYYHCCYFLQWLIFKYIYRCTYCMEYVMLVLHSANSFCAVVHSLIVLGGVIVQ